MSTLFGTHFLLIPPCSNPSFGLVDCHWSVPGARGPPRYAGCVDLVVPSSTGEDLMSHSSVLIPAPRLHEVSRTPSRRPPWNPEAGMMPHSVDQRSSLRHQRQFLAQYIVYYQTPSSFSAQLIARYIGSKCAISDRLSKLADRRPGWSEIAQSAPLWHTLHMRHCLAASTCFCTCGPSTAF